MLNGGGYQLGATHAPPDKLHAELRTLIASNRQRLASAVNAELTRLYWSVASVFGPKCWAAQTASNTATS